MSRHVQAAVDVRQAVRCNLQSLFNHDLPAYSQCCLIFVQTRSVTFQLGVRPNPTGTGKGRLP